MEKELLTAGSLALEQKQRSVIVIDATEHPREVKLRVAAYCRVSSDSDDQLNSFAAQNQYYTTLIASKENWPMRASPAPPRKSGQISSASWRTAAGG